MVDILKEYMKKDESNSYFIMSVKNIIVAICLGGMFYMQGTNGNILQMNNDFLTASSILIIMFSCNFINNELYIHVNKVKFKDKPFYKKIIASNISFILNLILYMSVLIIINIYIYNFSQGLKLLVQIIPLIILSTAVGNLLFITNNKNIILNITTKTGVDKNIAIIQLIKQGGISVLLGIPLSYLYLNYNSPILIPLIATFYMISLIINEKLGFDSNNIKA